MSVLRLNCMSPCAFHDLVLLPLWAPILRSLRLSEARLQLVGSHALTSLFSIASYLRVTAFPDAVVRPLRGAAPLAGDLLVAGSSLADMLSLSVPRPVAPDLHSG